MSNARPSPALFESVSRRTYWLGTGLIVAVLVALSWWAGLYDVTVPGEHAEARVTHNDPMTQILYSPLGNAVVMLLLQFFLANIVFWSAAWVRLRLSR